MNPRILPAGRERLHGGEPNRRGLALMWKSKSQTDGDACYSPGLGLSIVYFRLCAYEDADFFALM